MTQPLEVETEQIRAHARNLETIGDRFGRVKSASGHISQNDEAYGLLCGWISGVLEGRHVRQDELLAYVEENLTIAAEALRRVANDYDDTDIAASDRIRTIKNPGLV